MGTKQTHQRQSTQIDDYELAPLSELPLTKKTVTYNLGSTQTPQEIFYIIVSMLNRFSCLQLSMVSQLFQEFFIKHPIVCLSSKTKLKPQLAHLYYEHYSQSLKLTSLPQFLVVKNSGQLVEYKKTMHDDCLIIDFSKKLKKFDLDISRFYSLIINWPNDYKSFQDAIERSWDQFASFFQFQTFPNVKKVVLNNLVYSSDFIEFLIGTFNGLEYLNIASYNTKSMFNIPLSKFTTIKELEIMLPISSDFPASIDPFIIPIQLEKITFNGLQHNTKTTSCKSKPNVRLIKRYLGTSLKTIIIKNELPDKNNTFYFNVPACTENLISNTKGWTQLNCVFDDGCSHLIVIHVSKKDSYQFLNRSPDGKLSLTPDGNLSLNEKMCPNCEEFGVYDEDGNLQIIWRKQ